MKPEDVRVAWMQAFVEAYCRADGEWVVDGDRTRRALAAVISLVEAREREACAKVAEQRVWRGSDETGQYAERFRDGHHVAAAIRARGGA